MNIKLRTDVLSKSLIIENLLSGILSVILKFPKDSSKTLGHTGNPLSFKAKADLLNDLERLKDTEYKDLIMFMEIRNQLIHNLDTDTLMKAVERSNKVKKLLAHDKDLQKNFSSCSDPKLQDDILRNGFQQLYDRILNFSKGILKAIIQESEDEEIFRAESIQTEFLIDIVEFIKKAMDNLNEINANYSINETKEINTTVLIFFWQQIQKNYPNVFKNIENILKRNRKKPPLI